MPHAACVVGTVPVYRVHVNSKTFFVLSCCFGCFCGNARNEKNECLCGIYYFSEDVLCVVSLKDLKVEIRPIS